MMLGRSALTLGHNQLAVNAYAQGYRLAPQDPEVLIGYAEALANNQGQNFTGRPLEMLTQALTLSPDHPQGLWLMGMIQARAGNDSQALQYWTRLEAILPADGEDARLLRELINEIRQKLPTAAPVATPPLSSSTTQSVTPPIPEQTSSLPTPASQSVPSTLPTGNLPAVQP
jgi:cytochrome c-type biogenesis protein CcmH